MTGQDRADPSRVYVRRDLGVDPPSIAIVLDLERGMAEGDVALFVDDEAEPARVFELHRVGDAFRVCDLLNGAARRLRLGRSCNPGRLGGG